MLVLVVRARHWNHIASPNMVRLGGDDRRQQFYEFIHWILFTNTSYSHLRQMIGIGYGVAVPWHRCSIVILVSTIDSRHDNFGFTTAFRWVRAAVPLMTRQFAITFLLKFSNRCKHLQKWNEQTSRHGMVFHFIFFWNVSVWFSWAIGVENAVNFNRNAKFCDDSVPWPGDCLYNNYRFVAQQRTNG